MSGNGAPIDLNALARAHPPETFLLDIQDAVGILTVGEVVLAASTAGLSPEAIRSAQLPDDLEQGYRFLRAIAWVMKRRADPDVTWEDAQSWNVVPAERPPDPKPPARAGRRTSS